MKLYPPTSLNLAGKRAFHRALEALGGQGSEGIENYVEIVQRYARAVDLAARLTKEWQKEGYAALVEGSPNPIIKMISDSEKVASGFWKDLGIEGQTRRLGRPQGSPSAPDRKARPAKVTPK